MPGLEYSNGQVIPTPEPAHTQSQITREAQAHRASTSTQARTHARRHTRTHAQRKTRQQERDWRGRRGSSAGRRPQAPPGLGAAWREDVHDKNTPGIASRTHADDPPPLGLIPDPQGAPQPEGSAGRTRAHDAVTLPPQRRPSRRSKSFRSRRLSLHLSRRLSRRLRRSLIRQCRADRWLVVVPRALHARGTADVVTHRHRPSLTCSAARGRIPGAHGAAALQ